MTEFVVHGPFEVPTTEKRTKTRRIDNENIREFWASQGEMAAKRGCYVFAFRAGRGIKPVYIGKATKTFRQEVFTDHKLKKFHSALSDQLKGTPIVFFVVLSGRPNKTAIDDAESYLIQLGLAANSDLANDRKKKVPAWCIQGIVRSSKGAVSGSAKQLRRCFNLK